MRAAHAQTAARLEARARDPPGGGIAGGVAGALAAEREDAARAADADALGLERRTVDELSRLLAQVRAPRPPCTATAPPPGTSRRGSRPGRAPAARYRLLARPYSLSPSHFFSLYCILSRSIALSGSIYRYMFALSRSSISLSLALPVYCSVVFTGRVIRCGPHMAAASLRRRCTRA